MSRTVCAKLHKNCTSAGVRHKKACRRKKGVNECKWKGREKKAERRARASERQYRGAVLRASGKRVVSRILWTLHGETTTVTNKLQRQKGFDRKTKHQWTDSTELEEEETRTGCVRVCAFSRLLHTPVIFVFIHSIQQIYWSSKVLHGHTKIRKLQILSAIFRHYICVILY